MVDSDPILSIIHRTRSPQPAVPVLHEPPPLNSMHHTTLPPLHIYAEACLVMGIAAVGLVYVVVMVIEAVESSRTAQLLPDYCCFPTQHLLAVDGNGDGLHAKGFVLAGSDGVYFC
ncbi:unnamed protein product [Musa acuminata var. zebrina]